MNSLERRAVARIVEQAEALGIDVPEEVRAVACGEHGAPEPAAVADLELVGCCYGEAFKGPEGCTCWRPVYDLDQADPVGPPIEPVDAECRSTRCGDCAFRKGSPELADQWMREELLALPLKGEPFWCHDGMRRPVAYEHPVRGRRPASPDDWRPLIVAGVPHRADGRPALLCAGWAAMAARGGRDLPEPDLTAAS